MPRSSTGCSGSLPQRRPKIIRLDCAGPFAHIGPDTFIRTRLKTKAKTWLVESVRLIQARDLPPGVVRLAVTCWPVTTEEWERREAHQSTEWVYPRRRPKKTRRNETFPE